MPKVSVLIPSYNHEKFIGPAIQSVLDQSFRDFELIIVDDGSNDRTAEMIMKFKDPRIKAFIFTENKGAAIAMAKCLMEAKGEYIATLGSDDLFLPGKLEKQVKYLDGHADVGAVFSYAQLIDDDGKDYKNVDHPWYGIFNQPNRSRHEWLNYFFYNGNCLCHPSVLARRDCYMTISPPDPRFPQTGDFSRWISVCMKYEIYIIPENLVKFRIRKKKANVSSGKPETKIRQSWELGKILGNFLLIADGDELLKVFPELKVEGEGIDPVLMPYYIAKLALEADSLFYQPVYNYFALNTLYDLLADEKKARLLQEKHGFSYNDFNKLTGKYNVFNLFPWWTLFFGYSYLGKKLRILAQNKPIVKNILGMMIRFIRGR